MKALAQEMQTSLGNHPEVESLMMTLITQLESVTGKKKYGYLPKAVKKTVDEIVDRMEQLSVINECYQSWWELQCQVEDFYSEKERQRPLLSKRKEFRPIKNAVIQEAENIRMGYCENKQNKVPYGYYHCVKNGQGLSQCSMHYVRYDVLYSFVLSRLQYWINAVHQDEQAILERLSKSNVTEQAATRRATQEKKRAEKRLKELDNLLAKIYEDRLNEKITERNFSMLSQKYQQEQGELETRIEALTAQLASTKEQENSINKWVELIKQFSSPTELTAEMLNMLIEKIVVHEAAKGADGKRTQEIEIFWHSVKIRVSVVRQSQGWGVKTKQTGGRSPSKLLVLVDGTVCTPVAA